MAFDCNSYNNIGRCCVLPWLFVILDKLPTKDLGNIN